MTSDDGVRYPRRTLWYRFFQFNAKTFILPVYQIYRNCSVERFHPKKGNPMLVLHNHITDEDFFPVAGGYRGYTRFIISDAMTRNPLTALITEIVSDFIYRRKGDNADAVVKSIKATFDAGISMIMAPEGEESPNGVTLPIRKRTGQLIKDLNVDVLTYRLVGGYFVNPTWTKNMAKGPMFGNVIKVHTKEELSKLTPDEINDLIYNDLYINHYDWVKDKRIKYDRECRAEYMERELFICPQCKMRGTMHSHIDTLSCSECGYSVDVDEYGLFVGENLYFDNLYDWVVWQKTELNDKREFWIENPDQVIIRDDHMLFRTIRNNKPADIDGDVSVTMTSNELRIKGDTADMTMPLMDISGIALTNTDTFGVNYRGEYYILKSPVPTSARKYRIVWKIFVQRGNI